MTAEANRRRPINSTSPSRRSSGSKCSVRYEDCQQIADALKVGHAAVVDYYYTLESTAKNICSFLSGFVYAAEGCEERLSAHVFVYTPRHTGIQSGPKHVTPEHTLRFPWGR